MAVIFSFRFSLQDEQLGCRTTAFHDRMDLQAAAILMNKFQPIQQGKFLENGRSSGIRSSGISILVHGVGEGGGVDTIGRWPCSDHSQKRSRDLRRIALYAEV